MDNKRFRQIVTQRVQMERDFPPPTPRTRHNAGGFAAWCDFIEAEHRQQYEEGYQKPHERVPLLVVGARLMFDHKVYARWGELVFYHAVSLTSYRLHEVPAMNAESRPPPENARGKTEEMTVFG